MAKRKRHRHKKEGITESSVTIVAITIIIALFLLKASPQLPVIIDVGGAAVAGVGDAYTEKALVQEIRGTCFDTDSGVNQLVKGVVTINDAVAEDACNSDTGLVEYYCEKDKLKFEFISCPEYCREGKCVKKPKVAEYFKISQRHDGLEINEALGDVVESLTAIELSALRGGSITTKVGRTNYNQYFRFSAQNLESGSVVFEEDESGQTADFLKFESGEDMFEYELEFENGLESTINSNGQLVDLEGEDLNMIGRKYEIVEASILGSNAKIVFMSGTIKDSIKEGAIGHYQLDGIDYKVEVVIIEDRTPSRVMLKVNGVSTPPLEDGEIHITDSGMVIGIADILQSEAGEGSDIVRLYIGAQRVRFQDRYTDDNFETNVDINGEIIEGGKVKIRGSRAGGVFDFFSLKYRLEARASGGGDVYVSRNRGVKQFLKEPEGMLGGLDIVYGGLRGGGGQSGTVALELRPRGDDKYNLNFVNRNGNLYSIPYVSNQGGSFKLGTSKYDLIIKESASSSSFNIDQEDIFIVSSGTKATSYSAALRYDAIDVSNNVVHFDDLAVGRKSAPFTGTPGVDATGSLIAGGTSFKFFVGPAPDYALAMDMDNSGSVDSGDPLLVTAGGITIELGLTSLEITTPARLRDEPGKGDETITIDISAEAGNEVDANVPAQSAITMIGVNGERQGMSDVGIFVRQVKRSGGADKIQISLGRGGQRLADVAIVITAQQKPISKTIKTPVTGMSVFYDFIELE